MLSASARSGYRETRLKRGRGTVVIANCAKGDDPLSPISLNPEITTGGFENVREGTAILREPTSRVLQSDKAVETVEIE